MSENEQSVGRSRRRPNRLLAPSEKYEVWLRLVCREITVAEAAAMLQVDRSAVMRVKAVAKEDAMAASKPGVAAGKRDYGLEAAQAEV